jgi:hypothetical protein
MALTETTKVDQIEILENGILQIRLATIITKDGNELARSFYRYTKVPGEDISNEEQKVQAVANAIWTEEVIEEYQASQQNGL